MELQERREDEIQSAFIKLLHSAGDYLYSAPAGTQKQPRPGYEETLWLPVSATPMMSKNPHYKGVDKPDIVRAITPVVTKGSNHVYYQETCSFGEIEKSATLDLSEELCEQVLRYAYRVTTTGVDVPNDLKTFPLRHRLHLYRDFLCRVHKVAVISVHYRDLNSANPMPSPIGHSSSRMMPMPASSS